MVQTRKDPRYRRILLLRRKVNQARTSIRRRKSATVLSESFWQKAFCNGRLVKAWFRITISQVAQMITHSANSSTWTGRVHGSLPNEGTFHMPRVSAWPTKGSVMEL